MLSTYVRPSQGTKQNFSGVTPYEASYHHEQT